MKSGFFHSYSLQQTAQFYRFAYPDRPIPPSTAWNKPGISLVFSGKFYAIVHQIMKETTDVNFMSNKRKVKVTGVWRRRICHGRNLAGNWSLQTPIGEDEVSFLTSFTRENSVLSSERWL